jgi:hypothetical protein
VNISRENTEIAEARRQFAQVVRSILPRFFYELRERVVLVSNPRFAANTVTSFGTAQVTPTILQALELIQTA